MSITTLTHDELLQELYDLAQYQGVTTQEAWDELVEEVVNAHLDLGELSDDEDIEAITETLCTAWSEYEKDKAEPDQFPEEEDKDEEEKAKPLMEEDEDEENEEV